MSVQTCLGRKRHVCVYCVDLKQKVLPQATRLVKGSETSWKNSCLDILQGLTIMRQLPAWQIALVWSFLREVRHFIENHSEQRPCPKHRGTGFPWEARTTRLSTKTSRRPSFCGGAGPCQAWVDIFSIVRPTNARSLFCGSCWKNRRRGHLTVLGWKELFMLPVRATRTGE